MSFNDVVVKIRTILPEDTFGTEDQVLPIGSQIYNFSVPLSQGNNFILENVLQNGPVIINFIKGTWCPYCQLHLKNLREWQNRINQNNGNYAVTTLIVTNESLQVVRKWLENNPMPYLFASDESGILAKMFGVNLSPQEFLKPATFLIDRDRIIRMSYSGKRKDIDLNAFDAKLEK